MTALSQQNRRFRRPTRSGFTLVEIMVVIVIILLMLGMAVPVLHVITGSQSEAGAANMIAAMLGRARTDAIGLQRPIGVAFIYNPTTNVQTMAEVEFPTCQAFTSAQNVTGGTCVYTTALNSSQQFYFMMSPTVTQTIISPTTPPSSQTSQPNYWQAVGGPPLELKKDTDLQPLPAGIAVQTVCNSFFNPSGQRITDGYLSVGVILFDGQGRLTSLPYGICAQSLLSTSSGLNSDYPVLLQNIVIPGSATQFGVMSQFGLVVFQRNEFVSQGFPALDGAYAVPLTGQSSYFSTPQSGSSQTQQAEENWLDQNATPLLINRYTGTLIRGE